MFKIIGELINSTRKNIQAAVKHRDSEYIRDLTEKQIAAGAHWIDVNGGARYGHEQEDMAWRWMWFRKSPKRHLLVWTAMTRRAHHMRRL